MAALENVETLSLDAATFDGLRVAHPGIDRFLLMVVSARLRSTSQQLLEALYVPAELRLLRCLCRLAALFDARPGVAIPMTQGDIASMTGVTRSTVNRVIAQAQHDGVVRVGRAHFEILDPVTLRRRANLRAVSSSAETRP